MKTSPFSGFVAGAFSVVTFHQIVIFLLVTFMGVKATPWNLAMNPLGVPQLLSSCFWGGLWGVAYAKLINKHPNWATWLMGALFGLIGPMLVAWFVVPLIKGQPIIVHTLPAARIMGSMAINAAFGFGIAYYLTFFKKFCICKK